MEEKKEIPEETVGIVSMECYFPKLYISQSEFEEYNNVSSGKYTIGLGQTSMSFTSDREDIVSICLTVLSNLLSKNSISYSDIGWICVATETIIDHSKSIASSLQQLFEANGNFSIEGIDVKHACYGGTFALFTAFDRINSKYWDGKYCVVISADIAEYASGAARCTGGCGAVALLLGKNACIDLNILRASYKANEYDFYKPYLNSSYPVVNGHVSNTCYLNAFDSCFQSYYTTEHRQPIPVHNYWIFHAPYNKLVKKTFGRVIYHDFLNNPQDYYTKYAQDAKIMAFLKKYEHIPYVETVNCREVIKGFEKLSVECYKQYVSPSTLIPKSIGNCYTASIFMGLMSLIYECRPDINGLLLNKNILMFSYGSGTVASLYSLRIINSKKSMRLLNKIIENNDIKMRFQQRRKVPCDKFTQITNAKEKQIHNNCQNGKDFMPQFEVNRERFYENTYYLAKIDANKQRFYEKFECESKKVIVNHDKVFNEKNILTFLSGHMIASAHELLEKVQDNDGMLSKQGAIKIDKMINKTQEITTKCSNS